MVLLTFMLHFTSRSLFSIYRCNKANQIIVQISILQNKHARSNTKTTLFNNIPTNIILSISDLEANKWEKAK